MNTTTCRRVLKEPKTEQYRQEAIKRKQYKILVWYAKTKKDNKYKVRLQMSKSDMPTCEDSENRERNTTYQMKLYIANYCR